MPEAFGVENRECGGGQRELSVQWGERTQFSIRLGARGTRELSTQRGKTKLNEKPSIRLRKGARDDARSLLHMMDARLKIIDRRTIAM